LGSLLLLWLGRCHVRAATAIQPAAVVQVMAGTAAASNLFSARARQQQHLNQLLKARRNVESGWPRYVG
jgi:hypothetical protein